LARSADGVSVSSAFGTGYQLMFGTPTPWSTAERRVLQAVTEVGLQTGFPVNPTSQWVCPSTMQFVIIRAEDAPNVTNCNRTVDSYSTEAQRQALDAIRRVLPVEDFYVDVVNNCVVPKPHIATQSCYGNRQGMGAIDYSSGSCSGNSCPHYVSV